MQNKFQFQFQDYDVEFQIISRSNRSCIVAASLKRKLYESFQITLLQEYFQANHVHIKICNFCQKAFVPFDLDLEIANQEIKIKNVVLKDKQFQYCYGQSQDCKDLFKGRSVNPNSSFFVSKGLNMSEEEALAWIKNNNKSSFYRQNFKNDDDYRKSQKRDEVFFIEKYGSVVGKLKYSKSIERQNYSRSLEGYQEKFGADEGMTKHLEMSSKKDSMSFEFIKKKYGENHTNDELFELLKRRKKSVSFSKEKYILKHGLEKYNELVKKRQKHSRIIPVSKWATKIIQSACNLITNDSIIEIRFGSKNEFSLLDAKNNRKYYYDLYIKAEKFEKIIEMNGHKFHAPPNLSDECKMTWKNVRSKCCWEKSRAYDDRKIEIAHLAGIETLTLWDYDSDEINIEKAAEFINE